MLKCERLDADKRGDVFYKVARQFGKIKNIPKNAVSKPQVGNEDQQKTKSNAVVVDDGDLIPEDEDVQVFEEAKGHGSRAFNQDFFASGSSRKVTVEEDKDILRKRLAEQMRQFEARGGQVEVIECPLDKPDRRKHYRPAGHDLY